MFRKEYFKFFLTIALTLVAASAAFAQYAPIGGRIEMTKADGTKVPVAGAPIEVYRLDIKNTLPSGKSDKKGNFNFAGLPLGASFVLSVSAPGAKPGFLNNVKAGQDKILITLEEGDGKRWTEQEIRDALTAGPTTGQAEPTEEQKKAAAEYDKKVAELTAKNKETEGKNALISKSLTDGNAAFNAKNYDEAVARYTEGINADPKYVGSAPILLNNKGVALKILGIDAYNRGVKSSDAAEKATLIAKAKQQLEDSLNSFNESYAILKSAPATEITDQTNFNKAKYDALVGLTEGYRLLVVTKSNTAKAADAGEAFDAYIAIETDPAKKAKAQVVYGDVMREAGISDKAIVAYRAALASTPDNAEAMAGLGLSLFNSGAVANDKAQMQEGLNYMTKYIEASPIAPTDSQSVKEFKTSVKEAVDYLKNAEKLVPQKVSTPGKKKGN
jgi:tetratricopeptide (TPR) repeat protein